MIGLIYSSQLEEIIDELVLNVQKHDDGPYASPEDKKYTRLKIESVILQILEVEKAKYRKLDDEKIRFEKAIESWKKEEKAWNEAEWLYKELLHQLSRKLKNIKKLAEQTNTSCSLYSEDEQDRAAAICGTAMANIREMATNVLAIYEREHGQFNPKAPYRENPMIKFILDIDAFSTIEFCDLYELPHPKFTGDVKSSAEQFINLDLVKLGMIKDYAKKLFRESQATAQE